MLVQSAKTDATPSMGLSGRVELRLSARFKLSSKHNPVRFEIILDDSRIERAYPNQTSGNCTKTAEIPQKSVV